FLDGGLSTIQRKTSLKERYHIMCKYYGKFSTTLLHLWFAIRFYSAKWFIGRV
ncbi:MAG: glycosyltransferase, partial [Tannerellaceae bacterium]|nr:glycosyltransferase [Tannerellaceae bacterium]